MSDFASKVAPFLPFARVPGAEAVAARVRGLTRDDLLELRQPDWHPEFQIDIIDGEEECYLQMALDLVGRLQQARDDGRPLVAILPVGPVRQYSLAARIINQLGLDCSHLHSFNMDEYADRDGNTAPADWPNGFQYLMRSLFFNQLEPGLRPPESQIHFPTKDALPDYSQRLADLGGADVCYGGIGWCGHIAFWEPHLADQYPDFDEWLAQGAQKVDLHPMTIMQSALLSFQGDWTQVPPSANTIGPRDILAAKHRSFWLQGTFPGGPSWQAFIGRLVPFGPVHPYVPGSILQTAPGDYVFLDTVADAGGFGRS